jgi:hypothetical protein
MIIPRNAIVRQKAELRTVNGKAKSERSLSLRFDTITFQITQGGIVDKDEKLLNSCGFSKPEALTSSIE